MRTTEGIPVGFSITRFPTPHFYLMPDTYAPTDVRESLSSLQSLIAEENSTAAHDFIEQTSIDEKRRLVSLLSNAEREKLCELLPSFDLATLLENLVEKQAADILDELPLDVAAEVVTEMKSDDASDLLRELPRREKDAILEQLDDSLTSEELRERVSYPENTAGALMGANVMAALRSATSSEIKEMLSDACSSFTDAEIQYLYVVDDRGVLVGVVGLRDLLFAKSTTKMEEIMRPDPLFVSTDMTLTDLEPIFDEKSYLGLPVVNNEQVLKGVVSRDEVEEALGKTQSEDYMKSAGIVGGEELRSMPLRTRSLKRLAWLAPNIVLNLLAASVIATYEDTLQAVIALAVFLPMVSDMSGCSGNQAVAVSIRELTLGVLSPRDFLRVIKKEAMLGLCNGIILGTVLGVIAGLWKGNFVLGLVIGCALALNTLLSVLLGGLIPLVLKRFRADPALASGPVLTTCTDMCGFFLVLSFASISLSHLQ